MLKYNPELANWPLQLPLCENFLITPLTQYSRIDKSHCVEVLLAHGADQRIADDTRVIPFIVAVQNCFLNTVRVLYEHPTGGPALLRHTADGDTALTVASERQTSPAGKLVYDYLRKKADEADQLEAALDNFLPSGIAEIVKSYCGFDPFPSPHPRTRLSMEPERVQELEQAMKRLFDVWQPLELAKQDGESTILYVRDLELLCASYGDLDIRQWCQDVLNPLRQVAEKFASDSRFDRAFALKFVESSLPLRLSD